MLTFTFVSISIFAQNHKPFAEFDKTVNKEVGEYYGDIEKLSEIFDQERIRLGDDFETELWKYLGTDLEKYYRLSSFLDRKKYLHGNKPLPELAFKIRQRGLELVGDSEDKSGLGKKITFLRELAVASYLAGKRDLAIEYKAQTAPIYEKYEGVGVYVGATTKLVYCIFNNLEKDPTICKEESETENSTEKIINSGVISGRSLLLPQPKYPKQARKENISGDVQVRVVIDFSGNIISAEAVLCPKELYEAAVQAAQKAKFAPTLLDGKPVKVSGIIIYRFVLP